MCYGEGISLSVVGGVLHRMTGIYFCNKKMEKGNKVNHVKGLSMVH